MYRALSWLMIKERIDYKKEKTLQNILKDISIVFKANTNSHQDVYVNNYCVTEQIRSQKISSIVSKISSIKEVRKFLVEKQRTGKGCLEMLALAKEIQSFLKF